MKNIQAYLLGSSIHQQERLVILVHKVEARVAYAEILILLVLAAHEHEAGILWSLWHTKVVHVEVEQCSVRNRSILVLAIGGDKTNHCAFVVDDVDEGPVEAEISILR